MIETYVVDTNVLLVANGKHSGVSLTCVGRCADALEEIQRSGRVALDDGYRILEEYLHKTQPNQPKGPGDVFLKWIFQNAGRSDKVAIHPMGSDNFHEFPVDPNLASFDPPDRKFVAVAAAHPSHPEILQAADSKWLDWAPVLAQHSVIVRFLCQEDVARFHKKKFGS